MRSNSSGCAEIDGGARRRVRALVEALDEEIRAGISKSGVSSTMKAGAMATKSMQDY